MDKVIGLKKAISKIQSGNSIMIGGFTNFGCPLNLVYALAEEKVENLTIICEDLGYGERPYPQGQGMMLANGQIREAMVSFVGNHPLVNELVQAEKLTLTLIPQGTLAERIRAGGAGIGGFYTPTGIGTVVEEGKETKVINGQRYLLELPLTADVALIKARKADRMGNAVFRYASQNFNPLMAMAAELVILEVEQVVEPGEIEPDQVHLPGVFVDHVVLAEEVTY